MRLRLLFLLLACAGCASANSERTDSQSEIDQTLWKPFKAAFEGMDGNALNALYADDVLRVTPEGLDTEEQFKGFNRRRFDENIARGDRIELDFWFDSRHGNSDTAYEVGFFRVAITNRQGEVSNFYGQFHIVLQKIDGAWKIVQDWDTDQIAGQPINGAIFERGIPVSFD